MPFDHYREAAQTRDETVVVRLAARARLARRLQGLPRARAVSALLWLGLIWLLIGGTLLVLALYLELLDWVLRRRWERRKDLAVRRRRRSPPADDVEHVVDLDVRHREE